MHFTEAFSLFFFSSVDTRLDLKQGCQCSWPLGGCMSLLHWPRSHTHQGTSQSVPASTSSQRKPFPPSLLLLGARVINANFIILTVNRHTRGKNVAKRLYAIKLSSRPSLLLLDVVWLPRELVIMPPPVWLQIRPPVHCSAQLVSSAAVHLMLLDRRPLGTDGHVTVPTCVRPHHHHHCHYILIAHSRRRKRNFKWSDDLLCTRAA